MRESSEEARIARNLLIVFSGLLFFSTIAAPFCALHAHEALGAILYRLYAPVCHQLAERSFAIHGLPWAVCQRCSGILFGLFAGSFTPLRWWSSRFTTAQRRGIVLFASAPLLLDAGLACLGLWKNTAGTRFLTGAVFGAMLMTLLLPACAELAGAFRLRVRTDSRNMEAEGGV